MLAERQVRPSATSCPGPGQAGGEPGEERTGAVGAVSRGSPQPGPFACRGLGAGPEVRAESPGLRQVALAGRRRLGPAPAYVPPTQGPVPRQAPPTKTLFPP